MAGPYATAARAYFDRGWWPLHIPQGHKEPPPAGYTGADGREVTLDVLEAWLAAFPNDNVALRLPRNVVGVDVDAYGDKAGGESLAALERELGPLPATCRLTSRDDGVSGIRLLRLPDGVLIKRNTWAEGIEVLRFGHRYAMAPPSTHPSGRAYRLLDERAGLVELDMIPTPDELPELPATWCTRFDATPVAKREHAERGPAEAPVSDSDVDEWLRTATTATQPWRLHSLRRRLAHAPTSRGSRHDAAVDLVRRVVGDTKAGFYPAAEAWPLVADWWAAATSDEPARRDEAHGILRWALANVPASRETSEWNDSAAAERLAPDLEGRFAYVPQWRRWMYWDTRRWVADEGERVLEHARQWVADQRAALIVRGANDEEKAARVYTNRPRLEALVATVRRIATIIAAPGDFDTHHDLLNVRNGIVDLRTGELRDHDPALMLSKYADVDYRPGAHHPDVDAMLDTMPPEARAWVQRFFGYCTTGEVGEDVLVVLDGTGRNGKSTVLTAVQAALGDYAGPVDVRIIVKSDREEHRTLQASLQGLRLATMSETDEHAGLNGEKLKSMTGGDAISARRMYTDYFTFAPTHKFVVATNYRPHVSGSDGAVWERLRLVPFPYTYVDADVARPGDRIKDTRLRQRLQRGHAQRTAVLAWLVEGAVEWYGAGGLGRCPLIDDATSEWRSENDPMARFIHERLVFSVGLELPAAELYRRYVEWCHSEGHHPKSSTKFGKDFKAHTLVRERVEVSKSGHLNYVGIGVQPEFDPFAELTRGGLGGLSQTFPKSVSREEFGETLPTLPDRSVTVHTADEIELF